MKIKSSWVKAVPNCPVLSEHVLDVEIVEGQKVVEVPDLVIHDYVLYWDNLLEGRFLAEAPHVAKIHIIVNKVQPFGNASIKIKVFEVNDVLVKYQIKDSTTKKRLLKRDMYNIMNVLMILPK